MEKREILLCSAFLTLLLMMAFIFMPFLTTLDPDSKYYSEIASGNIGIVVSPFSSRALIPVISGLLSAWLGVSINTGFEVVAVLSFFIFAVSIMIILRRWDISARYHMPMLLVSSIVMQFVVADMPDPASAALIALSLAMLVFERFVLGALLAALSVAVREANIIFLISVGIFFVIDGRRVGLVTVILAGGAAFFLTRLFGSWGVPNIHFMNPVLYMALKMPVNFLSQVLGFPLWTDGFKWCEPPVTVFSLPNYLPTGNIHQIGLCVWHPAIPIRNLAILLSAFGALPAVYLAAVRGRPVCKNRWLKLVSFYGFIMILIGLCSGWAVVRLVGYGWPVFAIALPIMWSTNFNGPIPWAVTIIHIAIFPIYVALMMSFVETQIALIGTVCILFAFQAVSYRLCRLVASRREVECIV